MMPFLRQVFGAQAVSMTYEIKSLTARDMEKLLAAFGRSFANSSDHYIPPYRVEIHTYHWM